MLPILTLPEKVKLDNANSANKTLLPTLLATNPSLERLDFTNKPQLLDLSLSASMLPAGPDILEEF